MNKAPRMEALKTKLIKRQNAIFICNVLLIFSSLNAVSIHAIETAKANANLNSANVGTSSKNIDFEGSLVEGVNKRPWDSVSQVSDLMKARRKNHLYRIPAHFETENAETRFEMRFQK